MPGRKLDSVWLYFDKVVDPGKTGCRAKCKECGKDMQGLVSRLKQHRLEMHTVQTEETTSSSEKRPASPENTPTKRAKIDSGKLI